VSEAIYLEDPDGHGLEVYRDRPEAEWPYAGGELALRTDPLNLPDLLLALPPGVAQQTWTVPAGTRIGHVHLRVRDIDEARRFYVDAVGFDETTSYPGAAFLSVGGYHHHLGVNAWESAGRDGPGDEVARLLAIRGSLEGRSAMAELRERLGDCANSDLATRDGDPDDGDTAHFRDPSGTRWIVAAR